MTSWIISRIVRGSYIGIDPRAIGRKVVREALSEDAVKSR